MAESENAKAGPYSARTGAMSIGETGVACANFRADAHGASALIVQ